MTTTQNETIRTDKAAIYYLSEDVLYFRYDDKCYVEAADLKASHDVCEEQSKNGLLKLIIEFPELTVISADARQFAVESELKAQAEAIVFHTLAQRIIVRFYYLFHRKTHPVKIFTSKEKAFNWISSL
jgi:hypothetical protein